LKFYAYNHTACTAPVAPLAGAWIEIWDNIHDWHWRKVAPLAGAWIEIPEMGMQHLSLTVAPLAGAWIEIVEDWNYRTMIPSLPSRERGLKYDPSERTGRRGMSLPSRERGLKSLYPGNFKLQYSRSPRGSVD